jgi:hypothetical protein
LTDAARSVRLAVSGASSSTATARSSFQERMARALRSFQGRVLLILSGRDYTAREFTDSVDAAGIWRGTWQLPGLERCDLPDADHTFSEEISREAVENAVRRWLASLSAKTATSSSRVDLHGHPQR